MQRLRREGSLFLCSSLRCSQRSFPDIFGLIFTPRLSGLIARRLKLKNAEEAKQHNESTGHSNFEESTEAVRSLSSLTLHPAKTRQAGIAIARAPAIEVQTAMCSGASSQAAWN